MMELSVWGEARALFNLFEKKLEPCKCGFEFLTHCEWCWKRETRAHEFRKCAKCLKAFYCSRKCQRKHHQWHKYSCVEFGEKGSMKWVYKECVACVGCEEHYVGVDKVIGWSKPVTEVPSCFTCGKSGVTKRCDRCKMAYFCNRVCMKAGWKRHKKKCRQCY